LAISPSSPPALNGLSLTTFDAGPGVIDPHVLFTYQNQISALAAQISAFQQQSAAVLQAGGPAADALSSRAVLLIQKLMTLTERSRIDAYLANSGLYSGVFASLAHVAAYADRPVLIVLQTDASNPSANSVQFTLAIDLLRDIVRAIPSPVQATTAAIGFQIERGFADTGFETGAVTPTGQPSTAAPVGAQLSAQVIFSLAGQQGIALIVLTPADPLALQALDFPADAKARISDALGSGMVVVVPRQAVTVNGAPRVAWYQMDKTTGQTVGVVDDGNHLGEYTAVQRFTDFVLVPILGFGLGFVAGFYSGQVVEFVVNFAKGLIPDDIRMRAEALIEKAAFIAVALRALSEIREALLAAAEADPGLLAFYLGFLAGSGFALATAEHDPPAAGLLFDPAGSALPLLNVAENTATESATISGGAVQGSVAAASGRVSGQLQSDWTSAAVAGFQVLSLAAPNSRVVDASGKVVGSGLVGMSAAAPVATAVSGNNHYAVSGNGSLAFYGPAESTLGVSGEWNSYTADVTGNVSITITTDGLTLNGMPLPVGTYTIVTASATMTGSGLSTAPNFTGSASATLTGGTVNLGTATGNVSVGGKPLDPSNGATLTGYTGRVDVSAAGQQTDSFTFSGVTANVLTVTAMPTAATTDQNTPATFRARIATSMADSYDISAQAPPGWSVAVDGSGTVTATPQQGLQGGHTRSGSPRNRTRMPNSSQKRSSR
jgi:hypothetical protein